MSIQLHGCGQTMTSQEWLAYAGLLFGVERTIDGEKVYDRKGPLRFGCPHCEHVFESVVTPLVCPRCNREPGEHGVTVTHKGYSAVTFPFV